PRPLPRVFPATLPREWQVPATLALWVVVVAASIGLGYRVRDYALRNLSTFYTEDMAVISPARLAGEELRAAIEVATSEAQVNERISAVGQGTKLLVYVLPEAWMIADLPLDPPSSRVHPATNRGHHVPLDFDRARHRVLFTRARSHDPDARGEAIVRRA